MPSKEKPKYPPTGYLVESTQWKASQLCKGVRQAPYPANGVGLEYIRYVRKISQVLRSAHCILPFV